MPSTVTDLQREIVGVIRAIPRGKVATYGQVAELAGIPRGGRMTAGVLKTCGESLPWHRVVGKRSTRWAKISILDPVGAAMQKQRLESEGVSVTESGGISLVEFGWIPCE